MDILNKLQEKEGENVSSVEYTYRNKKNEQVRIYDFKHINDDINFIVAKCQIDNGPEMNICFTISSTKTLKDIINSKIFEELDNFGYLNELEENKFNYLGKQIERVNSNGFYIFPASDTEEKYIKKLNQDLQKELDEKQKTKRQEFVSEIQQKAKEEFEINPQVLEKREKRKQNPKLELKDIEYKEDIYGEDFTLYNYYEGTDLTTGKILRLNHTQYIQVKNKYIYTTFLSTTDEEGRKPSNSNSKIPFGYPVVFELPYDLEDAVKSKKNNKVISVLQLLSEDKEVTLSREKMKFLGSVEYGTGKVQKEVYSNDDTKKQIIQEIVKYNEFIKREQENAR